MSSKTSRSRAVADGQKTVDYWRLFRDLPDACLLFEASDPDYMIVEANKAREEMMQISRADTIGRPLFSVPPYTGEQFKSGPGKDLRQHLQQVMRTGRSYRLEAVRGTVFGVGGVKRTVYLQGAYVPLRDTAGKVCHILCIIHDVTDEMQAAEETKAMESRLSAALTIGKLGSWVFDPTDGRITGDENFKKLFFTPDELAHTYTIDMFLESVHKDDRPRVIAAVQRSLKRNVLFEEECRVYMQDGTIRWILARGEPEKGEDGTFSGVVVDLTEQRTLQAQVALARQQDRLNRQAARILRQRNEELEAISRSKDEFVALASHQLRTPATAVKQYIGMMLQGYVGDITEMQYDVLEKAFEGNERQIQIINQILSAARVDTGKLVVALMPLDLRSLVQGIAAEMRPVFEQREHTFTVRVPADPVYVAADLSYLRMAIENVVQNASVYTPKGGSVRMTLTVVRGNAVLRVSDTGVGIRKKDIGKLFVKFSRIHNPLSVEAGGSGIGLYLTAEIVRLHDGTVDVESRIGKGTTFAISLPLMHNKNIKKGDARRKG